METDAEVKNVISELRSGSGSSLYSALIMIRTTLIKSRNSLTQLVHMGAVQLLIQILVDQRRYKNQTKIADIVMSILANLCLEEDVREQVVSCDGLSVIAQVTLSAEQESIQNRGVRALANLALDVANCDKIFEMEVPAFVAKRLMESEDVECRSTYCRALQLFGQIGKDAKRLMEKTQAIQALAALLKLDNRKLALKSLRIMSELSALSCCPSFTGQILAANILEELVTLADDEDSSSASYSLSIILRLCEREIMRPPLGAAGVISLLVKLMRSNKSHVNKVLSLNALCLCTKEAVNRHRLQEAGVLELFISALSIHGPNLFSVLYDRIISSFVNFLYDDECLGKLLELGLVKVLLEHLQRSCAFTLVNDDFRREISSFAETFEANSGDRARHLGRGSITDTAGMDSNIHQKNDSVALDKNSASCSLAEYPSISVHHEQVGDDPESEQVGDDPESEQVGDDPESEQVGDDPESDCVEFALNTPVLQDQVDKIYQRVPNVKLNTGDEERECFIADENSDGMEEDVEDKLSENSRDTLEMSSQHTAQARHTFSINSPTYQMETGWRLEDYTTGVTCKSFSQDPESYSMPQHRSPSPYSMSTDLMQAPYSPLSGGASYYSPSQSSTSPSVLMSPVQSTVPSSPTSASYRGSPSWVYSSPENENIPASAVRLFSPRSTESSSPLSLAYQNQFSPLSNNFPASPLHLFGERYSQSPTPSSQTSPFSQGTYLEKYLPSFDNPGASEHTDLLLAASRTTPEVLFTAVPLSQDTVTTENIYSASEDDDDNVSSDVDNELNPSSVIADECANHAEILKKNTDFGCSSTNENIKGPVKPMSSSIKLISNKRGKTVNNVTCSTDGQDDVKSAENSKRRRLSHRSSTEKSVGGCDGVGHSAECISKTVDNSGGLSDDEEIRNVSQNLTLINSATGNLNMEKPDFNDTLPVTETLGIGREEEMQRPSSAAACSTLGFEDVKEKSFQRMASFPGKGKRSAKTSHFRKHLSGTVSSKSQMTKSLVASVLPVTHITDSPYRSPYSEPANNIVSSQEIKILSETNTTKVVLRSNSEDLFSCSSSPLPDKSSKVSNIDGSRREGSASTKIDTATRTDQSNDVRVKKIHRATEVNILILLARVSIKTNPTQILAESTVISCLLGYIASASNPIHRSCRILHRLCSNPLCFEKLILIQMPALLVKTLVLEDDGTFPHNLFCSDNRSITDFLPSSQGSECSGSQSSEFGRKMDFEFAGDAYSRLTSKKHSSLRSIFQKGHVLIVDGEASRATHSGDDIYEAGSSRVESRVRIGLELLHTLGAVGMSRFGEGEMQHILLRHSPQNKLACLISMLHLQVGWCQITRDKFFTKYSLCGKLLPCLLTPEAPLVREAIVAALSLIVHLDNPAKLTQQVSKLPVCPDLQSTTGYRKSTSKPFHEHVNYKPNCEPSLRNSEETKIYASCVGSTSLKKISEELVDGLRADEHTASGSRCATITDHTAGCGSNTATFCPYQNVSHKHDVCFFITDENNSLHKIRAHRKTLVDKSEVFAAMFSGSYAESTQSEISVPDVSKNAFEYIIHYLHGCSSDCPVIASLSLAHIKSEIITTVCVTPDRTESNSVMQQHDKIVCDEEDIEERNSAGKKEHPCVLNDSSRSILEVGGKHSEVASAERSVRTDTSTNISQVLEFTQSQDSLDSLTLEDRLEGEETSHACRKLNFKNPWTGEGNEDTEVHVGSQNSEDITGITQKCLEELISRCENILALADRFLLRDLIRYTTSVLSHVCLRGHTVEDIFPLACFYHFDQLAFDCIRETLMSCLPCSDAAAIYVQLAEDGYREQVYTALTWLVNHVKSD